MPSLAWGSNSSQQGIDSRIILIVPYRQNLLYWKTCHKQGKHFKIQLLGAFLLHWGLISSYCTCQCIAHSPLGVGKYSELDKLKLLLYSQSMTCLATEAARAFPKKHAKRTADIDLLPGWCLCQESSLCWYPRCSADRYHYRAKLNDPMLLWQWRYCQAEHHSPKKVFWVLHLPPANEFHSFHECLHNCHSLRCIGVRKSWEFYFRLISNTAEGLHRGISACKCGLIRLEVLSRILKELDFNKFWKSRTLRPETSKTPTLPSDNAKASFSSGASAVASPLLLACDIVLSTASFSASCAYTAVMLVLYRQRDHVNLPPNILRAELIRRR